MVGHSDDVGELATAWRTGDTSRLRTAVITGVPGVGKSRLVAAAVDAFDPAPSTILTGTARLHSPAPYDWLAAVLDRAGLPPATELRAPADALAWLAQDPDRYGMGTTCTAMLLVDDQLYLAHVGDSRGYLLHEGAFSQVTVDDTYVSQLHARVFTRDGQLMVEDLGSTNGTYLNRVKVAGPMVMQKGDRLQVGNTVLEVR